MRGLLAFWLVRWAWTQFTWTLNSADMRHRAVELATAVATAAAVLMAYALPTAFDDGQGLWFVVPYVAVRLVGLWLYLAISGDDPDQRSAVTQFATLSLIGLAVAHVDGALDTPLRSWAWPAVIVADGDRTGALVAMMVLGGVIAAELWWTYFAWVRARLEHALDRATGSVQSTMARDAFSFVHFGVVFAIIDVAVGLEGAVADPFDPIAPAELAFLVGGAAAFLLGTAVALSRTTGEVLGVRIGSMIVCVASCALAASFPAGWMFGLVAVGIAGVIVAKAPRGVAPSRL